MEDGLIQGKTYLGSQRVKCPVCGDEVTRQGLGSHKRLKHNIRPKHKKKTQMSESEGSSWSLWAWLKQADKEFQEWWGNGDKTDDKKLDRTKKLVKKTQDED